MFTIQFLAVNIITIFLLQTLYPSNLVKTLLYSTFQGDTACTYGKKMEEEIEMEVQKQYEGIEISHPSLTADSENKFLAGSPDGIGILENEKFLLEYTALESLFERDAQLFRHSFYVTEMMVLV